MNEYFILFETTADYTAAESTLVKPNVSLIEETNKVEYNPYIPERYIIYTAPEKLNVTWSDETATFGATIKSHTFENGVGTIEFNGNVTSIGEDAFRYCDNLTSIIIPDSVTSIGDWAFQDCSSLTNVTIGNSVTSIGTRAFSDCANLTSITIPNGVTSIDENAFYGCSNLTSIVVESSNTTYDSRDNCNAIVETATNTLITGCQNTTIPNSVTSIGEQAFNGCSSLTSITIPNSVTSINRYAFSQCTNLTSITIPGSVTSIGDNAFRGCRSLTNINIPNSVTSIGGYAFFSCGSLISVTVEATTPPTLESYYGTYGQFGNNASRRKIYVPSASVNAYKAASGWSGYANDIEAIPTA